MKKLFSLVAIAAVALTSFTSCKDNSGEPTPAPTKAKLTLSADAKVAVDANGKFTVTSNIAAPEAIVVTVKSSDEKVLTVSAASLTIAQGKTSAEGSFKGIADGKAKIEITATNATVSVASFEVTVGEAKPAGDIIMIGGFSSDLDGANPLTAINNITINKDNTFADICLESPDGVKALDGDACDNWVSGSLWYHTNLWTEASETGAANISLDNYGGDIVGTQTDATSPLYYTIVEENTVIDDKLTWIQNSGRGDEFKGYNGADAKYYMAPYVYSEQFPDINKGKSGYIVAKFSYKNSEKGIEFGLYRGWAKVSISNEGAVTVESVAICIGDKEFKTGQKQ